MIVSHRSVTATQRALPTTDGIQEARVETNLSLGRSRLDSLRASTDRSLVNVGPGWFGVVAGLGMFVLGGAGCFVSNPSGLPGEESDSDSDQTGSSGGSLPGTTVDGADTTSGSGASSGAPQDCARDSACIFDAPAGWEGPGLVALSPPGREPTCPSGSEPGFQMLSEPSADPAACECSCGPVEAVVCDGRVRAHNGAECPVIGAMNFGIDETCAPFPPTFDPSHHWSLETWVDAGGCDPTTETMLPPITVETQIDVCLPGPGGEACEGGVCLPEVNAEARHCVWAPGELPCPHGTGFSEKLLGYGGYDDMRGCLDCSCSSPEESCRASAELYSSADCAAGTQSGVVAWEGRGSCVPAIEEVSSARLVFDPDPQATCDPSEPEPVGSVVPREQMTFCCSPN